MSDQSRPSDRVPPGLPPLPPPTIPTPPAPDGPNRNRTWFALGAVLGAVALVVGFLVFTGDDSAVDDAADTRTSASTPTPQDSAAPTVESTTTTTTPPTTTTTEPGFQQAAGEIFLESAVQTGPEPFTGELIAPATPTPAPTTAAPAPADPSVAPTTVTAFAGDTPALYGGTRDNAECDKAGQLSFLQQHPEKAAAFVEALNGDPTLLWAGGDALTVAQLPEYFAELTPLTLTRDTRVTNHGYRDGRPTSRQVVLQAGTAVLVDTYGVPRSRCLCGNPLTAPQPVQVTPVYTGDRWPEFNPEVIVVMNQATIVIQTFVVIDIVGGQQFIRPAGSDGSADAFWQASVWQIDVTATLAAVDYFNTTTVSWSGQFTINGDGVVPGDGLISGTADGRWTFDGDCYASGGDVISTDSASGPVTVTLAGQAVTTELGRFLSIEPVPGGFAVDTFTATAPEPICEQDIYDNAESWVVPAFTTIEVQAEGEPVIADYASEGYAGTVTLTPLG